MTDNFLPTKAIQAAAALAFAVREYDAAAVKMILATASLPALAVALASMVDIDRSPSDMLAWNDENLDSRDEGLRPHGTHAAFNRHMKRGEDPCSACVYAERVYSRDRNRRRRAAVTR